MLSQFFMNCGIGAVQDKIVLKFETHRDAEHSMMQGLAENQMCFSPADGPRTALNVRSRYSYDSAL